MTAAALALPAVAAAAVAAWLARRWHRADRAELARSQETRQRAGQGGAR